MGGWVDAPNTPNGGCMSSAREQYPSLYNRKAGVIPREASLGGPGWTQMDSIKGIENPPKMIQQTYP